MKFNRVTIIDLEATCWEGQPPPGEVMETIEIGCCLYTKGEGLSKKRSILVKPSHSRVSPYCTQLTGHTWDELKSAPPFSDAIRTLANNYPIRQCCWSSWGTFDKLQLQKDCNLSGIDFPFGRIHLDLKAIYALLFQRTRGGGVAKVMKELELEFEGRHHNGADDAWNTVRVLEKLVHIFQKGLCNDV